MFGCLFSYVYVCFCFYLLFEQKFEFVAKIAQQYLNRSSLLVAVNIRARKWVHDLRHILKWFAISLRKLDLAALVLANTLSPSFVGLL